MLESGRSLLAPDGEEGAGSRKLSSSDAPGAPPPPPPPRTFWQHVYDEIV